jgi:hypothetical protein
MAQFRSSRHHREILLADWRDAEELASWYMREDLGLGGARITGSGNDRGIDVVADGAVAQVKHINVPVGAPIVQAALGAGHGNDLVLFFALSGYTRQAEEFAARSGVCLFQYDIYGGVRAANGPAREIIAKRKSADVRSIQDVRLNELRDKAAPALSNLEAARNRVEALAATLERTDGLENDSETLACIVAEYARFFAEVLSYDEAHKTIEAGWAELVLETMRGKFRVSRAAVDAGVRELITLHDELEDLDRLRQMSAAQWLRKLSDWEFRWNRIKYLTRFSYFLPMEDEPPLEASELKAVIDMNAGGKFKYTIDTRWLKGPTARVAKRWRREELVIYFAAAQKDPIGRSAERCLSLLEGFWQMDFTGLGAGPQSIHPLGWPPKYVDSLRSILDH